MKVNAHAYALLIRTLISHDCTYAELCEVTGLHRNTVTAYIVELHKLGVIHISQWLPNTMDHHVIKVFKFGSKKDVPRPPRLSGAEHSRRYRQKQRSLKNPLLQLGTPA